MGAMASFDSTSSTTSTSSSRFHSWFKLRWTPSSRSWLVRLDQKIRKKIQHKNNGEFVKVRLGDEVHNIWTVVVEGDYRDTVPIVVLHGMGGGSNMFLNNIDALAEQRDVILIDLPGFGLSSRSELRVKFVDGWWVDTTGDDIEAFYTEILEQWFKKMKLSKIILLGHSYGGYISSVYCLKYPKRVKHLILADPWGFPQRPPLADRRPFMRSRPLRLLSRLYSKMNIFTPIRALGPIGPAVFRSLRADLGRKFSSYFEDHTLSHYLYACNTCDKPSGETGFGRLSIPFGWAKKPLVDRVVNWVPELDVTFIFGARSWVDSQPGYETRNHRHDNYVDVQVISGAGHHVYADRPLAFNNMVDMIGEAVDNGVKPNISHEFEKRHLAMSSLRRRASCASQAELCNDEAGLRQLRALSESEMMGFDGDGVRGEGDTSPVTFNLDDTVVEEGASAAPVSFHLGSAQERKPTLRASKSGGGLKNVKFSSDSLQNSSALPSRGQGGQVDKDEVKVDEAGYLLCEEDSDIGHTETRKKPAK